MCFMNSLFQKLYFNRYDVAGVTPVLLYFYTLVEGFWPPSRGWVLGSYHRVPREQLLLVATHVMGIWELFLTSFYFSDSYSQERKGKPSVIKQVL